MRAISALGVLAVATLFLAACGGNDNEGDVTVFAASSLTAAFTQIGHDFEATHPGTRVTFNFAGSQELRAQLEQGADADVFASADFEQMELYFQSRGEATPADVFARNRLVIIVPKNHEAGVLTPHDLAKDGVKIVLANEGVPAGKYARAFLDAASADPAFGAGYGDAVLGNVVSEASNVREVVSAVQLGEVDAGIVYVTDVTDDVTAIEIPESVNQVAEYFIALIPSESSDATPLEFDAFVERGPGQRTLASFGFLPAE